MLIKKCNFSMTTIGAFPCSVRRWLQLRFDYDSTAIRPRYGHSTTEVTTV